MEVSTPELARWRVRSQWLTPPRPVGAADVVGHLLAVQAENAGQAAWAVATRTTVPDADDLGALLASGRVLRTHVLRPTWHFVRAEDVEWLIELTAPRVRPVLARQLAPHGDLTRHTDVVVGGLADGAALTRPEIAGRLERAGLALDGFVLMVLLADLELRRLVVSGPPEAGVHTYADFASRVRHPRRMDRAEALAELARRYVAGHGPATERDLAYWASLTLTDARRAIAGAGGLASLEHEGRRFWHAADQEPPGTTSDPPRGHLLQILDEVYRGYQDSRDVLDDAGAAPRGRVPVTGIAVVDGQVVAGARRTVSATGLRFDVTPYASWRPEHRAPVEDAAARYARFLGRTPRVRVAEPA